MAGENTDINTGIETENPLPIVKENVSFTKILFLKKL